MNKDEPKNIPAGCNLDDFVEITSGRAAGQVGKVAKLKVRYNPEVSGAKELIQWKVMLARGKVTWANEVKPCSAADPRVPEIVKEHVPGSPLSSPTLELDMRTRMSDVSGFTQLSKVTGGSMFSERLERAVKHQTTKDLVKSRTRAVSQCASEAELDDEDDFTYGDTSSVKSKPGGINVPVVIPVPNVSAAEVLPRGGIHSPRLLQPATSFVSEVAPDEADGHHLG